MHPDDDDDDDKIIHEAFGLQKYEKIKIDSIELDVVYFKPINAILKDLQILLPMHIKPILSKIDDKTSDHEIIQNIITVLVKEGDFTVTKSIELENIALICHKNKARAFNTGILCPDPDAISTMISMIAAQQHED